MAAEPASAPVNGNYGSHQQYGAVEPTLSSQAPNHLDTVAQTAGAFGAQNANVPSSSGGSTTSATNEGNSSIPKDEVGWYFVEQYYTTLSRNPEKLHVSPCKFASDASTQSLFAVPGFRKHSRTDSSQLFYSKRSQFVSGVEAEKVSVSVGPRVRPPKPAAIPIGTLTLHRPSANGLRSLIFKTARSESPT